MPAASPGSSLDTVEPIGSYALPNVPGKRVTIVRVFYGPGGFTRAHRHAGSVTAYITKGEIRSQLGGGPVEIFKVGQSFFEPPGATHLVSANASNTEPAELIAVFVADEGAQLTTFSNKGREVVMRGLVPRIHLFKPTHCRVKPG